MAIKFYQGGIDDLTSSSSAMNNGDLAIATDEMQWYLKYNNTLSPLGIAKADEAYELATSLIEDANEAVAAANDATEAANDAADAANNAAFDANEATEVANDAASDASEAAEAATSAASSAISAASDASAAATSATSAASSATNAAAAANTAAAEASAVASDFYNGIENFAIAVNTAEDTQYAVFENGYYEIGDIGTTLGDRISSVNVKSAIIECSAYDYIYLNVYGGGTRAGGARAYAFLDSDKKVIDRSAMNAQYTNYIVAPVGSYYMVLNNYNVNVEHPYAISTKCINSINNDNINRYIQISNSNPNILKSGIYTDFKPGYYTTNNQGNKHRKIASNPRNKQVQSLLIDVKEGEQYYIKSIINEQGADSFASVVVYGENFTVIYNTTADYDNYYNVPANAKYIAVNSRDVSNSFVYRVADEYQQFTAIKNIDTYKMINFELGTINDANGTKTASNIRARTVEKIPVNYAMRIDIPTGYSALIYTYDLAGEYIGYISGWVKTIKGIDFINKPNVYLINIIIRYDASPSGAIASRIDYINDNILVDGQYVRDYVSDARIKLIDYQINYMPSSLMNGFTIGQDGALAESPDYITTDFVNIPQKYNKNLNFVHAYSDSGNAAIIAFYDSDHTYISQSIGAASVDVDNTATFIRVVFGVSDTKCGIFFSNEVAVSQYEKPKKYALRDDNYFGYDANVISDGAMSAIINTGLLYLGDERFGYGTEYTAFATECIKATKDTHTSSSSYEGERYQLDCSTYVLLMLLGITPECSRYFSDKNIPSERGFKFNKLVEYEGWVYGVKQTSDTKRLYANSIAEYAQKNGYLFVVNDDMSNLRPGDVFFLSNQGSSFNFFENIGHCGMIVNTVPMNDGSNTIVTFEGNGGSTSPCKYKTHSSKPDTMLYAARFPMPDAFNNVVDIAQFSSVVTETISGTTGQSIDIATVNLAKDLESGHYYTVQLKCELPSNCYLQLASNGMSHLGVSNQNVLVRPDGYKTFRIFSKATDIITNPNTLTISAICTGSVSGEAILSMVHVYDGFVTPGIG